MLVYLFPPIRQYGGDFFYFFLILGLADPLTYLIRTNLMVDVAPLYIGISILLYFAITNFKSLKMNKVIFAIILIAVSYSSTHFPRELVVIFLFLIHVFIFAAVLKLTGEFFTVRKEINLFFVFLLLYELNAIVKFILAISPSQGAFFFYFSGFLNIPIGIYFAIATVKKPLWKHALVR